MILKQFQIKAIENLKQNFYELWKGGKEGAFLTFQSPTGSGKTVMMAEFLKQISRMDDAQFDADVCFVWISKGELAAQSKNKLFQYYRGHGNHLLDLHDLNKKSMQQHDIFFVNWEKIISRSKENRKLRSDGEANTSFDTFINNTHAKNRAIVIIIDEAHLNLSTELAQEIISIIKPRISIYVSATPKHIPDMLQSTDNIGRFVQVKHDEVVAEGLIKESIKIMPKEEVEAQDSSQDLDKLLLDLALEKQAELTQAYEDIKVDIKPLILVQLPNDEKNKPSDNGQNKKDLCIKYLTKEKDINSSHIATWLSDRKENLADIVNPLSYVKVLIFKQAIATGWDCPRSSILVSFREMQNPVFKVQVLGRVLRMPEAKHYENDILNHAYCYTSYQQQEISDAIPKDGENQSKHLVARLKTGIENINLSSIFLGRADYNDIGHTFQKTFLEVADDFFDLSGDDLYSDKKLIDKDFDTTKTTITNQLIVDADIEVYDDFVRELSDADQLTHESSYNDVRKFYELLLYKELVNQEGNSKFGNVSRSWRTLKNAFNVWLKDYIPDELKRYAAISNNLNKGTNSVLKKVIERALTTYKPIRAKEIEKRVEKERELLDFRILSEYHYSDDYKKHEYKKYVLDNCYIKHSGDELAFINHLEQQNNIDWWYKNADNGRDAFGIEYVDNHGVNRIFYPDFIVKQGDKIGIFDTKGGITAEVAKEKAEALQQYIASNSGAQTYKDKSGNLITKNQILWGGIVVLVQNNLFKFNNNKEYSANLSTFKGLTF
jgi:type III restriction enzyme